MADELDDLLESLKDLDDETGMVNILIEETVAYRDELKGADGTILTVGDTRTALDALEDCLRDHQPKSALSKNQTTLLKRWVKRINNLPQNQ